MELASGHVLIPGGSVIPFRPSDYFLGQKDLSNDLWPLMNTFPRNGGIENTHFSESDY